MSTLKPATTPPTLNGHDSAPDFPDPKKVAAVRNQFMVAALNMSWQLAVVVLVPLLAGFYLDKHLHSLPLWTFIGFVAGMAGMAAVVWRQFKLFSPTVTQADIDHAKRLRQTEESDE